MVMSDDRAWLQNVLEWLRDRRPFQVHRISTPSFPTRLRAQESHHFKHFLKLNYPLDTEEREHLVQLGAEDLYEMPVTSDVPNVIQRPAPNTGAGGGAPRDPRAQRDEVRSTQQGLGRSQTPRTRTGANTPSTADRMAPPESPPLESTVWNRDLLRWLDREYGLVQRSLGGWRIPHAELRQMIQHGLLDRAEFLIQELNQQNPSLVVELYRYQMWVDHSREDWQGLLENYENYAARLGNGLFLTFVADAYLAVGEPGKAGGVLLPLLTSDVPSADRAPAYALAARCHAALDEWDLARGRLQQAWGLLDVEQQERYRELRSQLHEAPRPDVNPTRDDSWDSVVKSLTDRFEEQTLPTFYELRTRVEQASGPVPSPVTHLLARLAARVGDLECAREAYKALWHFREQLSDVVLDEVREHLIRDAANRGAWDEVTLYVQGWYGVRADPELLRQIGQAFEATAAPLEAEKFYRLALEDGSDYASALRFLALLEYQRFEQTNNDAHVRNAHRYFTRLVALPNNGLTPDDAVCWLLALQVLTMNQEAEEAIEHVLGGLTIYDYAKWVGVFEAQAEHVWRNHRQPERLVRAFADHLLAAHQAGQSSEYLSTLLNLALQRLTDLQHQVSYLEEAEAIQDASFRQQVLTAAQNIALQEMNRGPVMNQELIQRSLMVVFSTGGESAYRDLGALYKEQIAAARRAGVSLESHTSEALLAGKRVALVGGHSHWQHLAENELTRFYGARHIQLVPPSWEGNQDESSLAARLKNSDLILVMWKCMTHSTSVILRNLIDRGVIKSSRVQPVAGTGGKGFVREVIKILRG